MPQKHYLLKYHSESSLSEYLVLVWGGGVTQIIAQHHWHLPLLFPLPSGFWPHILYHVCRYHFKHNSFPYIFFFSSFSCFLCVWVFCFCTCLVLKEARGGPWIPWNWRHRWLWVPMWMLGIEFGSSGWEAPALNCWAIFPVFGFSVLLEGGRSQVWGS